MDKIINYYKVLEVEFTNSNEIIKGAYKRLAFKHHPDRNKEKDLTSKMQEINEAYQVLKNPASKKIYDSTYHKIFNNDIKDTIEIVKDNTELKDIIRQAKGEANKITNEIIKGHKEAFNDVKTNKNQLGQQVLFYLIGFFLVGILMKACN